MPLDDTEIKSLIEAQGKSFEAFKEGMEEMKKGDVLTQEKLGRIEKSLDDAVEAKAKLEASIAAEVKEREALEAKLNAMGLQADSEADAKAAVALKDMNIVLAAAARKRGIAFTDLDRKSYDDYKSALDSYLRKGGDRGLSPDEVKAMSVGSDPDGGYLVTPDTSGRMVKKIYETSPMRQVAAQQSITSDVLEGIEDLGEAAVGYATERSTSGSDSTPQLGKWSIPVYEIDTEPKATTKLLDDASIDIEMWLADKVSAKFARFENAEFVAGAKGKIRGFTSYDIAADSGSGVDCGKIGYVASGASGAFASSNPADKIFDLIGALKSEYLGNAVFMTRRTVITAIRKFKDTTGQYLWQPSLVAGQPEMLAGHAIQRAEDMPALAANSLSLAFGDFRQGYQIVDRQGLRVLVDPFTAKPYVKFYTVKRTGGAVIDFDAIKLMKFAAS